MADSIITIKPSEDELESVVEVLATRRQKMLDPERDVDRQGTKGIRSAESISMQDELIRQFECTQ